MRWERAQRVQVERVKGVGPEKWGGYECKCPAYQFHDLQDHELGSGFSPSTESRSLHPPQKAIIRHCSVSFTKGRWNDKPNTVHTWSKSLGMGSESAVTEHLKQSRLPGIVKSEKENFCILVIQS
jgi:hypothetical protein